MNNVSQTWRRSSVAALITASMMPVVSWAYFEIREMPPLAADTAHAVQAMSKDIGSVDSMRVIASTRETFFRSIGVPGRPERVEGFGDDIPLDVAIEMIMPSGWVAAVPDASFDTSVPVSWAGGEDWVDTLRSFAVQADVAMVADWDRRRITIGSPSDDSAIRRAGLVRQIEGDVMLPRLPQTAMVAESADPNMVLSDGLEVAMAQTLSEPVLRITEAPEPAMTIERFMQEPINVDVRRATLQEVLEAMLPPGWTAEMVDPSAAVSGRRIDYTTPEGEPRGAAMTLLGRELGVSITPFPHLKRVVVTEIAR